MDVVVVEAVDPSVAEDSNVPEDAWSLRSWSERELSRESVCYRGCCCSRRPWGSRDWKSWEMRW